jgi:cell division protein FtsI/penicillin-binding protein 2
MAPWHWKALKESCDVYFYEVAQLVGIDKIAEMGRKLGLGVRHDLPMSAITEGVMPDKAWKQERTRPNGASAIRSTPPSGRAMC